MGRKTFVLILLSLKNEAPSLPPHLSSQLSERPFPLNLVESDLGLHHPVCVPMCLFKQHLLRTHQFRHAWTNNLD